MHLGNFLRRWLRFLPFEDCPLCGSAARIHEVRTLARERFCPGTSRVEAHLIRMEFARAAALDDPAVLGDQLVHQVVRCGDTVLLVTSEEPMAPGLESRIRRTLVLDGTNAEAAWTSAR
jgi:hypothetical protein